jgi:hypothetical protein
VAVSRINLRGQRRRTPPGTARQGKCEAGSRNRLHFGSGNRLHFGSGNRLHFGSGSRLHQADHLPRRALVVVVTNDRLDFGTWEWTS